MKTVLIARPSDGNTDLKNKLLKLGFDVIDFPTSKIVPINNKKIKKTIENIKDFNCVIFTSQNGVKIFFSMFKNSLKNIVPPLRVFAIGPKTAETLKNFNVNVDIVPIDYTQEGLYKTMEGNLPLKKNKILILSSKSGRDFLTTKLKKNNYVCRLNIYKLVNIVDTKKLKYILNNKIDYFVFTSSQNASNFLSPIKKNTIEKLKKESVFVSIGPVTSNTLKKFGINFFIQPKKPLFDEIVKLIKNHSQND